MLKLFTSKSKWSYALRGFLCVLLLTFFSACGYFSNDDTLSTCSNIRDSDLGAVIFDCTNKKIPDSEVNSEQVNWLKLSKEKYIKFNGIARYNSCSAALLKTTPDETLGPEVPAYLLTNGHCIKTSSGMIEGRGYYFDIPGTARRNTDFNLFYDSNDDEVIQVRDKTVHVASMDNTDVAIVELDVTMKELTDLGLNSYPLADEVASDQEVLNVGFPASGVVDVVMRASKSKLLGRADIKEDIYHFGNSYRHNCSIVGGSSGSAILDFMTHSIVAVNNTTVNDSSHYRECTMHTPCEVSDSGETSLNLNVNYAQPVIFLKSCFNDKGVFDRSLESCPLKNEENQYIPQNTLL